MELTKFAFGIRFCKGFHVEDQLGAIVDEILYSKDSSFFLNSGVFFLIKQGCINPIINLFYFYLPFVLH